MSKQEERRQSFEQLKKQAVDAIKDSSIQVGVELMESIEFSRIYSQLDISLGMLRGNLPRRNWELWEQLHEISLQARKRLRDLEAKALGVDLTSVS
jgi:hypothetical protein